MVEIVTDAVICGGGPVGLLLSYQLRRLGLSTLTLERYDKTQQSMYGRASTLYPRTNEMLDQLDLMNEMSQVGFIGRGSATFKHGRKVHGRGWDFISRMHDTNFDYCLNLRQRYSENVFRSALETQGGEVSAGWILKSFNLDEAATDGYKVLAEVDDPEGITVRVKARYIVGADGGRSTVRHLAGIPFEGERTTFHWIRIDAVIETDMPEARIGFGAVESPSHGNVLWVALDHGRTRIGFALTEELYEKYGDKITEEIVKDEAAKAMAPFKLKFVTVDWWTLYSIGQKVAKTFQYNERVLLAGDAGHTHSSGAAQGMNTGVHDAVNLGWKLGGVLKGWYTPQVLETYTSERRAVAQHLIDLDKSISALISGHIPDSYQKDPRGGDPNLVLDDLLESSSQFTIGLGVHYAIDGLLNKSSNISSIQPGHRAPDVIVRRPGSRLPTRLYELTKNTGKFWIVVFAGEPLRTAHLLQQLRSYLDSDDSFVRRLTDAFNFLTIIAGPGLQPDEVLGVEKFGHACYDVDHSAFARYGISTSEGGLAVLRPDGILGMTVQLNQGAQVGTYLDAVITQRKQALATASKPGGSKGTGELSLDSGIDARTLHNSRRSSLF